MRGFFFMCDGFSRYPLIVAQSSAANPWRKIMKRLIVLIIALLIPTAAMAGGECKEDKQKFCKDVVAAKGDVGACLNQHMAELSDACETKAKEKNAEGSAKMGKEEGTHDDPSHGTPPESDTSKIDQPERRNPTTSSEPPKQ